MQTRLANVKRLLQGVTPYGVRAPLPGNAPSKVLAGAWIDKSYEGEILKLQTSLRQCLPHAAPQSVPVGGAEGGDDALPLAFSHGLRAAARLLA